MSLSPHSTIAPGARAAWGRADVRLRGEATRFKNISQLPTPMDASPNTEPGQETQGAPGTGGLAEEFLNDDWDKIDLHGIWQGDIPLQFMNACAYPT